MKPLITNTCLDDLESAIEDAYCHLQQANSQETLP